jgi:hypothetical protein
MRPSEIIESCPASYTLFRALMQESAPGRGERLRVLTTVTAFTLWGCALSDWTVTCDQSASDADEWIETWQAVLWRKGEVFMIGEPASAQLRALGFLYQNACVGRFD